MNTSLISNSDRPFITVIIPTWNEERFIENCLNSLIGNDYPAERMEILVIDGGSTDRTKEIVSSYVRSFCVRLLHNPQRIVTAAFNMGIRESCGDIIVIMGAHAEYDRSYLAKCSEYLQKTGADCVGGICEVKSILPGIWPQTIAAVLAHPLGAGNSPSRLLRTAQWVDTVPFGAYRREVFQRVGLFDERINGSEDLEFNYRLRRQGGRIYMTPEIRSWYYPRTTLDALWKQHFRYGFSNVAAYRWRRQMFAWRHYGPLALVLLFIANLVGMWCFPKQGMIFVISSASLYIMGLVIGSAHLALQQGARYFLPAVVVASVIHIGHGVGSLYGLMHWGKEFFLKRCSGP